MFPLLLAIPQQLHLDLNGSGAATDFGKTVIRVADLNGDGLDDIAVGAPKENRNGDHSGSVYVYSSADGTLLWRKNGAAAGHFFGHDITDLGDLNGDLIADLAIASKRDNDSGFLTGKVEILSGVDGSLIRTHTSTSTWDRFGHSVASAGDIDGDGFDDLLIGAPNDDWSGPGSGCLRAFSGQTGDLIHLIRGNNPWDMFSWSLAGVGDINGDGYSDFAAGAPRSDTSSPESGYATIYSGNTGSPIHTWHGRTQDALGHSLIRIGDVDADGIPDLAIGGMNDFANLTQKTGVVEIRSMGGDFGLIRRHEHESRFEAFASSLGAPGDINGDGGDDLIVGAPGAGDAGANGLASGAARVISGLSGAQIYGFEGDSTNDVLGTAVSGIGDLNQDGFQDFIISEPGGNPNSNVYVYLSEQRATLSVNNFVSGATAIADVANTHANSPVTFLYSTTGFGSTTYPSGLSLDLAEPISILGTEMADNTGNASLSFSVPAGSTGATIYLQAWSGGGPPPGSASTAIAKTVQ